MQSFHEPTVRRAGALLDRRVPVALLVESARAALLHDRERVTAIARFASGIGPRAHNLGPNVQKNVAPCSTAPWAQISPP